MAEIIADGQGFVGIVVEGRIVARLPALEAGELGLSLVAHAQMELDRQGVTLPSVTPPAPAQAPTPEPPLAPTVQGYDLGPQTAPPVDGTPP